MKILFIGSVEFSKKTLQKLIELNSQVVGVCTRKKSKFNNDFADLKPLCKKNKIPFKLVNNIKESLVSRNLSFINKKNLKNTNLMHLPEREIWALVSLEMWFQNFLDNNKKKLN